MAAGKVAVHVGQQKWRPDLEGRERPGARHHAGHDQGLRAPLEDNVAHLGHPTADGLLWASDAHEGRSAGLSVLTGGEHPAALTFTLPLRQGLKGCFKLSSGRELSATTRHQNN